MELSKERHLILLTVLAIALLTLLPAALVGVVIPDTWHVELFDHMVPYNIFLIPVCLVLSIIFRLKIKNVLDQYIFQ